MSTDCEMETAITAEGRAGDNMGPTKLDGSIVTLIVGPEKETLEVAEDLLCDNVSFFHNAFEGNFVEAKTRTFTFPDDEPADFRALVAWLKGGSVSAANSNPSWLWLSKLWIFGEKYHIDDLQNEIINTLNIKFATHVSGVNISYDTLDYVVENTYQRSPLRRLFVDMLTNGTSLHQLPSRVANIPPEMLQDMVVGLKETVYMNNPTAVSLLTNPVEDYYTSSAHCKANAMPIQRPSSEQATPFYCDGNRCKREGRPIWDAMFICTHHQCKYCEDCAPYHRGHRLKLISLTTPTYKNSITGPDVNVIDGHINDSGFYCDGPACDPGQNQVTHINAALMSGDRYHCLDCRNVDYCTLCMRGPLTCKDQAHSMLRIRPTFAKRNELRDVSLPARQERARSEVCWRCGTAGHGIQACEEEIQPSVDEVEVEE